MISIKLLLVCTFFYVALIHTSQATEWSEECLNFCKEYSNNCEDNESKIVSCDETNNLCISLCKQNEVSLLSSNLRSASLLNQSASDCKRDMFIC